MKPAQSKSLGMTGAFAALTLAVTLWPALAWAHVQQGPRAS